MKTIDWSEVSTDELLEELDARGEELVDIENLSNYSTSELLEELEDRDVGLSSGANEILQTIYNLRRLGKDYQRELDNLIYQSLGKIL